jgi:hypothetical protein
MPQRGHRRRRPGVAPCSGRLGRLGVAAGCGLPGCAHTDSERPVPAAAGVGGTVAAVGGTVAGAAARCRHGPWASVGARAPGRPARCARRASFRQARGRRRRRGGPSHWPGSNLNCQPSGVPVPQWTPSLTCPGQPERAGLSGVGGAESEGPSPRAQHPARSPATVPSEFKLVPPRPAARGHGAMRHEL